MTVVAIPLAVTPAQTLSVQLGQQSVRLVVQQKRTGLYVDVLLADVPVVTGVLALNDVYLVREAYRGFAGDLYFHDTQGSADPSYEGFGTRWVLLYAT